ncbi:hypothetical protein FH972_020046 [Carpinus fangiana]|uniref:Uncharacterized protein n=1 Tax=Carpinus fangiana TaxID=176857 RepID=A0A5N6RVH6_9ROSI|nr:hypothetical protein FH972_020046 [Carpinus fangiana]
MDPANTPLGRMLVEEITPVVMVLCTPLVEESCLKNGLSFVEMLSPFCSFNNIDVPVRTASDQPYRLQKFKLRLFYASDIGQPNLEVAKERLKQVITQAGEKDDLCSDHPHISNLLASPESGIQPSWFEYFNKELVRTMSFSDHESFDHPVACLLVVSSKDEQPINRFVDLFNTNKLPSLLNDGAMDPKILKHYLLVHDNQDSTQEKAAKILTEMRSTFGSNDCQLLCINSSPHGLVERPENPWAPYKCDPSPSQCLGCFLNIDDFNKIKDLMQDLSSKHIIPYMEQKIRVLNQQVSATRKGLRNQIKNLWWRKGKEDVADSPDGPMYTFSSIESQIRVLGDYAFMLRDYELALSNYRLISTDYKLDKAWKRYAGVQVEEELKFIMETGGAAGMSCAGQFGSLEEKIGPSGQQNATRCGLWWVEMLKTRDQYTDAASVYFRICGEEPLHSAVMLEQASYCYLLSKPPMLRKFGFHLVLSGDRYKKCDQIKHAIRTYRSAVSVFEGITWGHINDHVHFHIGQWYAILGMYDLAVKHMLEVLACSHQSKITQEFFLRDFLQIVQKTGKTIEVLKLQLPKVNISSLRVVFDDHRTYASPAAAAVGESLWHSLEEDMIPSVSTARTNWLDLQSKLIPKKYRESNVCVAGEAVKVDIELKNPLQIPISISSVSLICELSVRSDEMESDASSKTAELQNDDDFINLTTNVDMSFENSSFTSSEVDLSLGGGETTVVQLTVTPKVEGILQIVGVRWKLSGSVIGLHNFDSNHMKKKNTKGKRKAKHSPRDNLKFIVIKSLPKLEGFIHSLPEKAYAGDIRHLVLELRNQSQFTVQNLKMKISHPRFLNIGDQENLKTEFPSSLEKKKASEQSGVHASSNNLSQTVFLFPKDTSIQGKTPLLWPLWLRAAVPGDISLYITVYYEMGDISSIIKFRTLRMHYDLQVLPSLDVSFQISPCPSRLQEFLVRMDVVNSTSSESFQVHQLSSVGHQWEISLLQHVDTMFPSQSLMAGQALSCFFMLKSCRKSLTSQDKISTLSPLLGSDVRLGPEGSNEPLFDICSSPLADFHHCERLHLGMSHQGDPNTVDFILISRPVRDNITPGMIIYNSADAVASVRINTFDSINSSGHLSEGTTAVSTDPSGDQAGWRNASVVNDIKVTSDVGGSRAGKSSSVESVPPFIWSGTSSTRIQLEPMTTSEIPLQICVFSPGIYDLSNYVLHWKVVSSNDPGNQEGARRSSGTCQGYPYYLSVLQSA